MYSPVSNFKLKWNYLKVQNGFRKAPFLTAARLIYWRARCVLRWSATIHLTKWNAKMLLPPRWHGIEKLVFAFREDYEPELPYLNEVLSTGQTFVDAGAGYGIYSIAASRLVGKAGRVIAFEPSSRALPILRRNVALNHLNEVVVFPLGLSENPGSAKLFHHPNVGCDSLGRDQSFTCHAEEIATDSLDNVLHHAGITRVDVIKIDVQGAEELVLRGAKETLASTHPIIILEIWPEGPPLMELSPHGAWQFLESLGYEFFVVERSGTLYKIKRPPAGGNVVAIYEERKGKPWVPGATENPWDR